MNAHAKIHQQQMRLNGSKNILIDDVFSKCFDIKMINDYGKSRPKKLSSLIKPKRRVIKSLQ